jgi:hypothetical protein
MRMGEERREQKGKEKEDKNKSKYSRSVDERFSDDNERTKYNSVEEEICGEKRRRARIRRRQRAKKKNMNGSNTNKNGDLSATEEEEYQSDQTEITDLLEEEENYIMEEIMKERDQNGAGSSNHVGHEDDEEPLIRRRRQHRQHSPHDAHDCQPMVNRIVLYFWYCL